MRRVLASVLSVLAVAFGIQLALPLPALCATSLQNSGLEIDANRDGLADYWQRAGYGSNVASWARTTDAHSGSFAERVTVKSWVSGDRKLLSRLDASAPAALPGHSYQLKAWYKATVSTPLVVFVRSTTGAWRYWNTGPTNPAAAAWTLATWTAPALPADATAISFGLAINRNGTLTVDDLALTDATSVDLPPPPSPTPAPSPTPTPSPTTLLSDTFSLPDGLITNEFAYWNPSLPTARLSPTWEMTSGSLFVRGGAAWTGVPDAIAPDATSSTGTNSAVFRLTTRRSDFGDVAVRLALRNDGLSTTASTPATAWDGVHVWLRYQSEESLYYASVNRRDNTVVIKKKVPGGPSNGGTYYQLAQGTLAVPYGAWQQVRATVRNEPGGAVTIQLYQNDRLLVSATDNGSIGGPPITAAGKVGIRGDNANFQFDDLTVEAL